MKKILVFIMSVAMLLTVTACGNNAALEENSSSTYPQTEEPSTSKPQESEPETSEASLPDEPEDSSPQSLIVYFSWGGNTEIVASDIQSQTGADIFELVPETPYTEDYNTLLDIAQQEQRDNARPAISGNIENFDSYDVIYVGFPNWWADMPMILYSFFDNYDLTGKTIALFCTSGGSGFSSAISTMRDLEPGAEVLDGLHIGSSAASNSTGAITEWLTELGLTE